MHILMKVKTILGYFTKISEISVILDANGGSFPNGRTKKIYNGKNLLYLSLNETITNGDKKLIGWADTKAASKPKYTLEETIGFYKDTTLYAVWEEISTYTLKTGLEIFETISNYRSEAEHINFTSENNVPQSSILLGNIDENDQGNVKAYYDETTKTVYLSALNTDSVIRFNKDSSHMFSNGKLSSDAFSQVQTLDITDVKIDTGYVENFAEIFKFNTSITQSSMQAFINILNTSSTKNMCAMFEYLGFDTIDVSSLDTSNVTDMSWMFHGSKFTNILFGDNFDTTNVKNYDGMFQELKELDFLDISTFKVSHGSRMDYMFGLCPKLQRIYVSQDNSFYENTYTGSKVFENDVLLVGGIGENAMTYDSEKISKEYAKINTEDTPGYFTDIEDRQR